jgi:ribosomal protein S18 acetylase RimI-like enzyme
MDHDALLREFDARVRRHPDPQPEGTVERDGSVLRCVAGPGGWNGVVWSDLDDAGADAAIAAQVRRFAGAGPWEWKHYSYDRPADLPKRLLAAGFSPEQPEALLVAEIARLDLDVPPPAGIEVRTVADDDGIDAVVRVHDAVFGEHHPGMGAALRSALHRSPAPAAAVVAYAGERAVAAARVEFHPGTGFASLWGGGTLLEWRRRGLFRALVARRAALAAARGCRYLQVDALPTSAPILRRLGFAELAQTTPYLHPGGRL